MGVYFSKLTRAYKPVSPPYNPANKIFILHGYTVFTLKEKIPCIKT